MAENPDDAKDKTAGVLTRSKKRKEGSEDSPLSPNLKAKAKRSRRPTSDQSSVPPVEAFKSAHAEIKDHPNFKDLANPINGLLTSLRHIITDEWRSRVDNLQKDFEKQMREMASLISKIEKNVASGDTKNGRSKNAPSSKAPHKGASSEGKHRSSNSSSGSHGLNLLSSDGNTEIMVNGTLYVEKPSAKDSWAAVAKRNLKTGKFHPVLNRKTRRKVKEKNLMPARLPRVTMLELSAKKIREVVGEEKKDAKVDTDQPNPESDPDGMELEGNDVKLPTDKKDKPAACPPEVFDNKTAQEHLVRLKLTPSVLRQQLRKRFGETVMDVAFRKSDCRYIKVYYSWDEKKDIGPQLVAEMEKMIASPSESFNETLFKCVTRVRPAAQGNPANSVVLYGADLGLDAENFKTVLKERIEEAAEVKVLSVEKFNCVSNIHQIFVSDIQQVKMLLSLRSIRIGGRPCRIKLYKRRKRRAATQVE